MRTLMISALFATVAVIAPHHANAEPPMNIDLPQGQVEITRNEREGFGIIVQGGGQRLDIDSAYLPEVKATYDDSVLLQVYSGGNACPADYVWLTFDAEGLRVTSPFGTCSEGIEIAQTDGYPAATMPGMDDRQGWYRYDFDGRIVKESAIGRMEAGISANDPAAWEGTSAFDLLSAKEMYPALMEIMSDGQLGELRQAVELTSDDQNLHREGDWLVATGCRASACDVEDGAVAISLTDGRPVAVIRHPDGSAAQYFGADPAEAERVFSGKPAALTPAVEDLQGYWAIVAINGRPVGDLAKGVVPDLSVEFDLTGAISGQSFCNRWIGAVDIRPASVSFSGIAMTRMACSHMAAETELVDILQNANSLIPTENGLELWTADGHFLLMVRPG